MMHHLQCLHAPLRVRQLSFKPVIVKLPKAFQLAIDKPSERDRSLAFFSCLNESIEAIHVLTLVAEETRCNVVERVADDVDDSRDTVQRELFDRFVANLEVEGSASY